MYGAVIRGFSKILKTSSFASCSFSRNYSININTYKTNQKSLKTGISSKKVITRKIQRYSTRTSPSSSSSSSFDMMSLESTFSPDFLFRQVSFDGTHLYIFSKNSFTRNCLVDSNFYFSYLTEIHVHTPISLLTLILRKLY